MNFDHYKNLAEETVIQPMIEFMEEWEDSDYTVQDVERCRELIYGYLENLSAMPEPTDAAIMEQVKGLVLALNELNEQTEYTLIETDAREALCEWIQTSAEDCGLQNCDDDITEQWREW